jgi:GMP synthase (glutamine-hydrolysing)
VLYVDAPVDNLDDLKELDPAWVIVLGGPIGVYQEDDFPFLRREINFLSRRLEQSKPMLGICLGSQLIAPALGARVYPGPCKEIGWKSITLTGENTGSGYFFV